MDQFLDVQVNETTGRKEGRVDTNQKLCSTIVQGDAHS